ncbi:MAG: asparagine synthase-related protein [Silvibacterium sp.]
MSIIFGICSEDQAGASQQHLEALARATRRYACDGLFTRVSRGVGMGIQPYHTHERSLLELQPIVDERGNLLTLDGRLDNYKDLCEQLDLDGRKLPDSAIALSAFRFWGDDCFSRFVGDWALALWSRENRSLYLARDHAGVRTLYFEQKHQRIRWSTYLETFFAEDPRQELDIDFAACYLTGTPSCDLTPFQGIRSVPAAHYIRFGETGAFRKSYWEPLATEEVRYNKESEYDAHFLSLFRQSVERRTGKGAPIIAHLSGGMDSTAIVCVADQVMGGRSSIAGRCLQTLSYYDDSEPNWNERPFFSVVEQRRGATGIHIQTSFRDRTFRPASAEHLYLFPGSDSGTIAQEEAVNQGMGACDCRVILSGMGGDELLGGFPTPHPELADLIISGNLSRFVTQSFAWSALHRRPLTHTMAGATAFLRDSYLSSKATHGPKPPWLTLPSTARFRPARSWPSLRELAKARPSALHAAKAWWHLLETLPSLRPEFMVRREYRYPYLDRDLVDFLLRIPQDQLVRPGRRRYMMRRALKGVVPEEILERRRKAYLERGPVLALLNAHDEIRGLFSNSALSELGLLNPEKLLRCLEPACVGRLPHSSFLLMRAVGYELWLQSNTSRISSIPKKADMGGSNAHLRAWMA